MGFIFSSSFVWSERIQIVALGTSATQSLSAPRAQAFAAILGPLLKADGVVATVPNAGLDKVKLCFMFAHFKSQKVNRKTQILILETDPGDGNIGVAVGYTEKSLGWLHKKHLVTISVSFSKIGTDK